MPHLLKLTGSCIISDGGVTKRAHRQRPARRVMAAPQRPRKPTTLQRVLKRIVLDDGTRGMLTAVGSPPPSPYKPAR